MESAIRCPACRARVKSGSSTCPGCGARLKKKAASGKSSAEITDDDRLGRKKRRLRKKTTPTQKWAIYGGIGAGALLLLVGVGWMTVRGVQDMRNPAAAFNSRPAVDPAAGPGGGPILPPPPPGPAWLAKVDPPKEVIRPKEDLSIEIVGSPHFASGNSPFVADLVGVRVGVPEPPRISVYDIRTGEKTLTAKAIQHAQSTTSPDGSFFVALGPEGKTLAARTTRTVGKGRSASTVSEVLIYKLGNDTPVATLPIPNHLVWMEFGRDDDQLVYLAVPPGMGFSAGVIDLKKKEQDPDKPPATLEIQRTPIRWRNGFNTPGSLAISPGRNYVAVGEGRYVDLIQLSDGKLAGACGLPGDCVSVAFSPDGKELFVHSRIAPERRSNVAIQNQWTTFSMADGKQTAQEQVTGGPAPGPLLAAGPKPGLAMHHDRDRVTVTDTRMGATVYSAQFQAVRHVEKDQLLGFDPKSKRVILQRIDEEQLAAGEKELATIFGPRPKTDATDRAGMDMPPEPNRWTLAIDAAEGDPPSLVDSHSIPGGADFIMPWTGSSALSAMIVKKVNTPRDRYSLQWQRIDLKAGKGEPPVELWPSMLPPGQVPPPGGHGAIVADQTADGSRIAVRDAATNSRVDIWDSAGKRLHGFEPYGAEVPIDALVWTGNDRLITMGGTKVTCWEMPGRKAVFEVAGYSGAFTLSPGRKWIALQTDKHIDIYETTSGKPLGRLANSNSTGKPWQAFAVSRDGTQLAATELMRPNSNDLPAIWSYATWDLKTGRLNQADRLFAGSVTPGAHHVMWIAPQLLLAGGASVIDLDARAVVATLSLNPAIPISSPDGRYWGARADRVAINPNQRMPNETIAATKLDNTIQALHRPAAADIVFRENSTIEIVSNTGSSARDAVIRSQLNGLVVSEGYRGDRGGWRLAVTGERYTGSGSLETAVGGKISIPAIRGKVQLLDPGGAVVWETTASGGWDMYRTKYKTRTEQVGGVGPGSGSITHYDFGGRDPGSAMAEEAWDNFAEGLKNVRFPRVLARVNGKIEPLPIALPAAGK